MAKAIRVLVVVPPEMSGGMADETSWAEYHDDLAERPAEFGADCRPDVILRFAGIMRGAGPYWNAEYASDKFVVETEEILGRADSPPLAAAVEFARKTRQAEQDLGE